MIKTRTKIIGNKLETALVEFAESVRGRVAMAGVAAMAKVIYDEARDKAPESFHAHYFHGKNNVYGPFPPGSLRNGIYRTYSPEKSTDVQKIYHVTWNHRKVPYGFMVEFGTSRAPATPFLRPAFAKVREAIRVGKGRMAEKLREVTAETK